MSVERLELAVGQSISIPLRGYGFTEGLRGLVIQTTATGLAQDMEPYLAMLGWKISPNEFTQSLILEKLP